MKRSIIICCSHVVFSRLIHTNFTILSIYSHYCPDWCPGGWLYVEGVPGYQMSDHCVTRLLEKLWTPHPPTLPRCGDPWDTPCTLAHGHMMMMLVWWTDITVLLWSGVNLSLHIWRQSINFTTFVCRYYQVQEPEENVQYRIPEVDLNRLSHTLTFLR